MAKQRISTVTLVINVSHSTKLVSDSAAARLCDQIESFLSANANELAISDGLHDIEVVEATVKLKSGGGSIVVKSESE